MSQRIERVTLDEGSIKSRSPEVENERKTAVADLLHENHFALASMDGPYDVRLSVQEGRLAFDIRSGEKKAEIALSVLPLKTLIRDYFLVCEGYFEAIKKGGQVEAIDMGRRGLHNEGAEMLKSLLSGRIEVDFATARRLFTLICVLHIR